MTPVVRLAAVILIFTCVLTSSPPTVQADWQYACWDEWECAFEASDDYGDTWYCAEWYAYEVCDYVWVDEPGQGGGGGGGSSPTVQIHSESIRDDHLNLTLAPSNTNGRLVVQLLYNGSDSHAIYDSHLSGGTYWLPYQAAALPPGDYHSLIATWYPGGGSSVVGAYPIAFRALGTYRHSQYNTPNESACGGQPVAKTISVGPHSACQTTFPANLRSNFVSQVQINGTGRSIDVGTLKYSAVINCAGHSDFTQMEISGAYGSVSDETVAMKPGHPFLQPHNLVLLAWATSGPTVKSVTDLCPGCAVAQLDNYNSTNAACSGNAVGDLGHFQTIRIGS